MNKEELRDLLKKQVKKFERKQVYNNECAFCWVSDISCVNCPFPCPPKIPRRARCVSHAVLNGQTDMEIFAKQLLHIYPPARAKVWAEWYRAWLDSPTLTPPPLEWKEE